MKNKKYIIGKKNFNGTKLDKIFFPKDKITKKDLIDYYVKVAVLMVPYISGRPINMMRAPNGLTGEIFYMQHRPKYFPSWVGSFIVKKFRGSVEHVVCNNLAVPAYLAEEGFITFHIWNSKINNLKNPDRLVFDLDPPERTNNFDKVRNAAFIIKEFFDRIDVRTFLMTTGSRGVHVVIPLDGKINFGKVRKFAKKVAEMLSNDFPDQLTSLISKKKRKGRVFIDYLRNSYGQTAVAPYSVRLKEGAPIAAPISWDDLIKKKFNSQEFNIENIFQKIKKNGDVWATMSKYKYNISVLNKKISQKRSL
ncbi:MAG TPA: non-homologous end-joining DNA ligase [Patescibacteria group bacterium]|nr:non-homologous end-joining DNA ligase [Patescibacteria group bacterium]